MCETSQCPLTPYIRPRYIVTKLFSNHLLLKMQRTFFFCNFSQFFLSPFQIISSTSLVILFTPLYFNTLSPRPNHFNPLRIFCVHPLTFSGPFLFFPLPQDWCFQGSATAHCLGCDFFFAASTSAKLRLL